MGFTEASTIIHAPVQLVWETLNDIHQTPKWVVGLEKAEIITEAVYGKGSIYKDYNRLGSTLQISAWKIIEFEPQSCQVHMSDSAWLPSTMTLTLEPVMEGTRLTMCVDYQLMWRWQAIRSLFEQLVMNHILGGVLRQNLRQLDQYLQHEPRQIPRKRMQSSEV